MGNPIMEAALEYVAQGFKVFPVKTDKTPLTEHGLKDATQLQIGVRGFWTRWPEAGIGLVTDGLVVIDFDVKNEGTAKSKVAIEKQYGPMPKTRTHRTGGGGLHYLYRNPNGTNIRNTTAFGGYPGVDLRANGGYIVVPPSLHESGRLYEVLDNCAIAQAPDWVMTLCKTRSVVLAKVSGDATIPEGGRNQRLTSMGGAMRRQGMPDSAIAAALHDVNLKQCNPPLQEYEVDTIVKSVCRYAPGEQGRREGRLELSHSTVLRWVELATGAFNVRQMWTELNINSPEAKAHLRVILQRLREDNVIAPTATDGTYRRVDNEKKEIAWEAADPGANLPIVLPFDIHKLCKVYPKSIIIVAGSKNEGKTAFLMSCIMPNVLQGFDVDFYNSETGPEQLKMRFAPLNVPSPAPFKVYERYDNFGDVIDPTHLSIIDYMDTNSEVYMVGAEIDAVFRKLTTGVAIIGLQKPPPGVTYVRGVKQVIDRDLAYGGGFSAKRAVVYISLSSHKLKLVYVKTPANPRLNPNNAMWTYSFDDNGYFTNCERFYPSNEGML